MTVFLQPRTFLGLWLLVLCMTGCPPRPQPEGHAPLTHTEKLEPYECGDVTRLHTFRGIFLASQPAPADFEQARKGGIKTVINLRTPNEQKDFDERAVVTGLGMAYHNPGWNGPEELTDARFAEVQKLLAESEKPVLLHCSSANRVGAHWIVYRMLSDGLDEQAAITEAKIVGLKTPAYQRKALDYVERQKQSSP